jgi:hypothetical protein
MKAALSDARNKIAPLEDPVTLSSPADVVK